MVRNLFRKQAYGAAVVVRFHQFPPILDLVNETITTIWKMQPMDGDQFGKLGNGFCY